MRHMCYREVLVFAQEENAFLLEIFLAHSNTSRIETLRQRFKLKNDHLPDVCTIASEMRIIIPLGVQEELST